MRRPSMTKVAFYISRERVDCPMSCADNPYQEGEMILLLFQWLITEEFMRAGQPMLKLVT